MLRGAFRFGSGVRPREAKRAECTRDGEQSIPRVSRFVPRKGPKFWGLEISLPGKRPGCSGTHNQARAEVFDSFERFTIRATATRPSAISARWTSKRRRL